VLRRLAEYHNLEGAFGRRAITERAKGILMEPHSVNDATAFEMLRHHSRDANRKLFDSPLPSSTATASCPKTLTPEPRADLRPGGCVSRTWRAGASPVRRRCLAHGRQRARRRQRRRDPGYDRRG
jgi:hypothetical protein